MFCQATRHWSFLIEDSRWPGCARLQSGETFEGPCSHVGHNDLDGVVVLQHPRIISPILQASS